MSKSKSWVVWFLDERQFHLGKVYKRCADCGRLLAEYTEDNGVVRCINSVLCTRAYHT